ncbi:MaoC family dehydratase N-terminal domain-containing protein [Nocardioides sp.]|uniref:FAS1-like dehydratase domain-containing protein n=1 Tax=Nocardioides sp. TaxID=35761 RepID=UPI003513B56C
MPLDAAVGRRYRAPAPYVVTPEAVAAFAAAVGVGSDAVPPTFPIVPAFVAVGEFLRAEDVELARIVHGEQRFAYERPVRVGDVLDAELSVDRVRSLGGNDIISTSTALTDPDGALVCTAVATFVHRGAV